MKYETGKRFGRIAEELFDGNMSDLAKELGFKPGSFTKYSSGNTMPGGKVLQRLARLDINLNWFLLGEGPMRYSETLGEDSPEYASEEEMNYKLNIQVDQFSERETQLLNEVHQFSDFLRGRNFSPALKRALLEEYVRQLDQKD